MWAKFSYSVTIGIDGHAISRLNVAIRNVVAAILNDMHSLDDGTQFGLIGEFETFVGLQPGCSTDRRNVSGGVVLGSWGETIDDLSYSVTPISIDVGAKNNESGTQSPAHSLELAEL